MERGVNVLCVTIVGLALALGSVNATCLDSTALLVKITECLNNTTISFVNSEFCTNKEYVGAVTCIEDLYNECVDSNQDKKAVYDKIIVIENYNNTFEYICENLQGLASRSRCSVELNATTSESCSYPQERLVADLTTASVDQDSDAGLAIVCKFLYHNIDCSMKGLEQCDEEVMVVMKKFSELVIPQGCIKVDATHPPAGPATPEVGTNEQDPPDSGKATSNTGMILVMIAATLITRVLRPV